MFVSKGGNDVLREHALMDNLSSDSFKIKVFILAHLQPKRCLKGSDWPAYGLCSAVTSWLAGYCRPQ